MSNSMSGPLTPPRRFVIVSSPRSGTHMLRTTLDNHSRITCLAESLNPDLIADEPHDLGWSTEDVLERHIFRTRPEKILAMGFAVHRSDAPLGPWTDVWEHLLGDPRIHIVMLHRHHLLRRYLSFTMMRERNRSGDPSFEPKARPLDAETLRQDFLRYEAELAAFRRRFAAHPRLQLSYEDLRDRFETTTLRLQRFLGVPIEQIKARTDRNAYRALSDLVTNLQELQEIFHGSRWEWFFAEERRKHRHTPLKGPLLVRAPPLVLRRRDVSDRVAADRDANDRAAADSGGITERVAENRHFVVEKPTD